MAKKAAWGVVMEHKLLESNSKPKLCRSNGGVIPQPGLPMVFSLRHCVPPPLASAGRWLHPSPLDSVWSQSHASSTQVAIINPLGSKSISKWDEMGILAPYNEVVVAVCCADVRGGIQSSSLHV